MTLMWSHVCHMGEPMTFLLQDDDGEPTDAAAFLDELHCWQKQIEQQCEGQEPDLNLCARRTYAPVCVYISLLDDPKAEPADLNNMDEVGIDEWSPLYLAIAMQHMEVVCGILRIHQRHGLAVLRRVLCMEEGLTRPWGRGASAHDSSTPFTSATRDDADEPGPGEVVTAQLRGCVGQPMAARAVCEFMGAFVVATGPTGEAWMADGLSSGAISCSPPAPCCGAGALPFSATSVTDVLQPLLRCLVRESAPAKGAGVDTECGFARRVVEACCTVSSTTVFPVPRLLVGLNAMYEVCMGDPHALLEALGAFGGLLVPVFGGCYLPHAGDRNTSTGGCVMQGDLPLPCGASTGCPRLEGTLPSLFLTFLAQEAHKLAFAVTWVNFRAVARVPPDDGSPGSESCWSHCGRTVPVHSSPAGLLWSVHFYCLSRLALCSCGAEEFCSLVKVAEGMQVGGMPFVYVAALAAGALVASFPARCDWVAPLQEKLQVLCGTGSTAPSTLQRYIALPVADELERFTLLWFGGTWLTSLKKFKSRSELLFFALVELVLLGSEEQWRRPGLFTSSDEQETAERALAGWLEGCRNLFAGANGDGGDGVARDLCARLPQRLERGASPCGAVGAILYPGGARSDDLASVFAAAQRAFATLVSAADSEQKLRIYGLYKQATAGNISVAKPYFVDVVGRAKWEAWNALKGMDAETARRGYVRAVDELRSSVDSRRQCS